MRRLMFAATTSGTGKTTICCGIQRAFRNRKMKVQPFKVGPDYIDTEYHFVASGEKSRNLDEFMLPKEEIKYLFAKSAEKSDINIIEGVMGLYDGLGASSDFCSSASMAKILDCPVILIIDGKAMAASAAALVLGYKNLDPDVKIAGVIANNVSTSSHFNIIKNAVEKYTGIPVLAHIPKDENFSLSSRHLGLTPSMETEGLDEKLDYIAGIIEKQVDLDNLLEIANASAVIYDDKRRESIRNVANVRLGIAYDKAFNFYYQDALELLEEMGVELVRFSPISDKKLPENLDGLFLGGGFPEVFAKELAENIDILQEIRQCSKQGMPIYAECGGLMYLGASLQNLDGDFLKMTGILDGQSVMSKRLQRFGYCEGIAKTDNVIADAGETIRGHEFHYSDFVTEEDAVYDMQKQMTDGSVKKWLGGYQSGNTMGTYLHTHFAGNYEAALRFVERMKEYRKKK
ncbi:MAG: cobyrinate a,c-diamide synthase [Peptostreptococcaceae bacterium]|nr:cobyrinate a,c-diamide synthase [Peptostreptococcaceae bacterium]